MYNTLLRMNLTTQKEHPHPYMYTDTIIIALLAAQEKISELIYGALCTNVSVKTVPRSDETVANSKMSTLSQRTFSERSEGKLDDEPVSTKRIRRR